jgi:predicted transcriptional regulator
MTSVNIKLPDEITARSEALKELTGMSLSALLRQAITAGLPVVEKAHAMIYEGVEDLDPADQAVS